MNWPLPASTNSPHLISDEFKRLRWLSEHTPWPYPAKVFGEGRQLGFRGGWLCFFCILFLFKNMYLRVVSRREEIAFWIFVNQERFLLIATRSWYFFTWFYGYLKKIYVLLVYNENRFPIYYCCIKVMMMMHDAFLYSPSRSSLWELGACLWVGRGTSLRLQYTRRLAERTFTRVSADNTSADQGRNMSDQNVQQTLHHTFLLAFFCRGCVLRAWSPHFSNSILGR